jgi:hypothetical protein
MSAQDRVIVTVHGIRTFGQWQERLKALVRSADEKIIVANYSYGYFSVIAFIIPMFRWLAVRSFRQNLRRLIRKHPNARFSFVAHSFGTHLVAYALRGMRREELPEIDVVLVSASVLKSTFDWEPMMQAGDDPRGVRRVINDCGLNDSVLVLSQAVVLFTGMAGRVGFYGFSGLNVSNRFFPGGHSHYFEPASTDRDSFMSRYWLPVLARGDEPESGVEIPLGSAFQGVQHTIFRIADPVKLGVYGLLGFLLFSYAYLQPRVQARIEQARREFTVAAVQMTSARTVPDAFESVASILTRDLPPRSADYHRAETLARFALQRLTTAGEAVASREPGSVFAWSDFSYLAGTAPVRLGMEAPIAFFADADKKRTAILTSDTTLAIVDGQTGAVVAQEPPEPDVRVGPEPDGWKLNQASGIYLLSFRTENLDPDDNRTKVFAIDLGAGTIKPANRNLYPNQDCTALETLPALAIQSDDDDGPPLTADETAAQQDELARREALKEKCLDVYAPERVEQLPFPRASPEEASWSVGKMVGPPLPQSAPCELHGIANFPHTVRFDTDSLVFPTEAGGMSMAERAFREPMVRSELCFIEFVGPDSVRYVATSDLTGSATVAWFVCKLGADQAVGACGTAGISAKARGDAWISPDRQFLAFAGLGEAGFPAWLMLDLETMRLHEPDRSTTTATLAMAFAGDTLVAVAPTRARDGGIEVWSYSYGTSNRLRARRVFTPIDMRPPGGTALASDPIYRTVLFESDGNVVMATAFQLVAALDLQRYATTPEWFDGIAASVPKWLSGFMDWLAAFGSSADAIVTPWAIPETGLNPDGPVTIEISPNRDVLAIASGSAIRLIQAGGGQYLTGQMDLLDLQGCEGDGKLPEAIQSIVIDDDLGITVTTGACMARRAPPPTAETLNATLADLSAYLGGGTPLSRELPGEVAAPSGTAAP